MGKGLLKESVQDWAQADWDNPPALPQAHGMYLRQGKNLCPLPRPAVASGSFPPCPQPQFPPIQK